MVYGKYYSKTTRLITPTSSFSEIKRDLAQYLYGCAFSPVISTFQQCINKGNCITWPGIDNLNLKKLIHTTEATTKGRLDQERKKSIHEDNYIAPPITSNVFYRKYVRRCFPS